MFADSLLESAPHPAYRAAWSKLASVLLQGLVLAIALAIPLLHGERLRLVPPPPSIRMTSVEPLPVMHEQAISASASTPMLSTQMLTPRWTFHHVAQRDDQPPTGAPTSLSLPCGADCAGSMPITSIVSSGPAMITVRPPHPPKPARVSEMQLGGLLHKVLPEYPIIAKQLGVQGAVILRATVGKDGRVEHVQPVSGPSLLVRPAIIAVEQWQYRPYLLNQEPVVVETQITVNFVLNRN